MGGQTSGRGPRRPWARSSSSTARIGHAFGDIDSSQHDLGGAEVWIEIERISKLGDGFVVATGEVVDHAKLCHAFGDTGSSSRARSANASASSCRPMQARYEGIETEGRLVVRVQLDSALELSAAFDPIEVVMDRASPPGSSALPRVSSSSSAFSAAALPSGYASAHRHEAIAPQERVAIGQAAVRSA